jgi:transcription antitermination factor NusG
MTTIRQPWVAVHVRSRHEKTVEHILRMRECEPFLPLYRARRVWSDRVKDVDLPLFSGYVFCRFEQNKWMALTTTPGVLQVVEFAGKPAVVDEREIEAIQTIVASRLECEPWPFVWIGQPVRVVHGCLRGVEGCLAAVKGQQRLVVNVTLLGRSCAVTIDRAFVAPV